MIYETYLENLKIKKTQLKFFLGNKVMLAGTIIDFDHLCIIVKKDKYSPLCMIIREQLASIMPE